MASLPVLCVKFNDDFFCKPIQIVLCATGDDPSPMILQCLVLKSSRSRKIQLAIIKQSILPMQEWIPQKQSPSAFPTYVSLVVTLERSGKASNESLRLLQPFLRLKILTLAL